MRVVRSVAVVGLVLASEVLAIASFPIWSLSVSDGEWLPFVVGSAALLVWMHAATPSGWLGGRFVTPVVRAVLYCLAVVAVWTAGHHVLAVVQSCLFLAASELTRVPGVHEVLDRVYHRAPAARDDLASRARLPVDSVDSV